MTTTIPSCISRQQALEAIPQIKSGLKQTAQLLIDDSTEGNRHRPFDYGVVLADAIPPTEVTIPTQQAAGHCFEGFQNSSNLSWLP